MNNEVTNGKEVNYLLAKLKLAQEKIDIMEDQCEMIHKRFTEAQAKLSRSMPEELWREVERGLESCASVETDDYNSILDAQWAIDKINAWKKENNL